MNRKLNPFAIKVAQQILKENLLLPPFKRVMLVDYPLHTGSNVPHCHSTLQIIAVVSGEMQFNFEESFRIKPGDILLIPANVPHTWETLKEASAVQLLLFLSFCEEYMDLRPLRVRKSCVIHMHERKLKALWKNIVHEQNGLLPATNVVISSLLLKFLADMMRIFSKENLDIVSSSSDAVTKVYYYIIAHYAEKITLQQLASVASLSVSRFSALFRERTGKAPMEFLIWFRLEKVREMIFSSDLRINEIAERCGFTSICNFHRLFLAEYRCTPGSYRRSMRKEQHVSAKNSLTVRGRDFL